MWYLTTIRNIEHIYNSSKDKSHYMIYIYIVVINLNHLKYLKFQIQTIYLSYYNISYLILDGLTYFRLYQLNQSECSGVVSNLMDLV